MGRNPSQPRGSRKTQGWALCGDMHGWECADADRWTWRGCNSLMPEIRQRLKSFGKAVAYSCTNWRKSHWDLTTFYLSASKHTYSHLFIQLILTELRGGTVLGSPISTDHGFASATPKHSALSQKTTSACLFSSRWAVPLPLWLLYDTFLYGSTLPQLSLLLFISFIFPSVPGLFP